MASGAFSVVFGSCRSPERSSPTPSQTNFSAMDPLVLCRKCLVGIATDTVSDNPRTAR
jgi:hypothetical protein